MHAKSQRRFFFSRSGAQQENWAWRCIRVWRLGIELSGVLGDEEKTGGEAEEEDGEYQESCNL